MVSQKIGDRLQKAHGIHVILPRGLKTEEEEQSMSGLSTTTSFFSNYERQRSIRRFMDSERKYMSRSRQSYIRKLETKKVNQFNAIPKALQTCDEAKFVARFKEHDMAIYNMGKEHRMVKLKLKIAATSDAYASMQV